MSGRFLKAVLILPGTVLVYVPALLAWLAAGTAWGTRFPPPNGWAWVGALLLGVPGLVLMAWSSRLFVTEGGGGTPAPWDPIERMIVAGPYRYVRNPMLIGVILFLFAEAAFFASWALAAWAVLFTVANMIYFPLYEEPQLAARYGQAYADYKANVPRWLPRLSPWHPGGGNGA